MTNLWTIFPSGNSEQATICARAWRDAGYRVAVLIDAGQPAVECDQLFIEPEYRGTAAAFNRMMREIDADAFLCVNDDVFPGEGADAATFSQVFSERFPDGFGVMQAAGSWYAALAWCAPYPLIGREFIRRTYGGTGCWHEGYYHLYPDQELRDVAIRLNAYAEAKDVCIEHRHKSLGFADTLPPEKRAKNEARAAHDANLYAMREAANFPGHQ